MERSLLAQAISLEQTESDLLICNLAVQSHLTLRAVSHETAGMDPISIAAACVGLISGLTAISTKLNGVRAEVKNANKEILALQGELESCRQSLSLFYGSGNADSYPENMRNHIMMIIRGCKELIGEIDSALDKILEPTFYHRVQWSMTIRDEVLRLHRSLESQKSALMIAISMSNLSLGRDVHSDTASIRGKAARIPQMQEQLAAIWSVLDNSNSGEPRQELSVAMQRFLQDDDTQSLTGSTLTYDNTITSETTQMLSELVENSEFPDWRMPSSHLNARHPESGSPSYQHEIGGVATDHWTITSDEEHTDQAQRGIEAPLYAGIARGEIRSSTPTPSQRDVRWETTREAPEMNVSSQAMVKKSFWQRLKSKNAPVHKVPHLDGRMTASSLHLAWYYLEGDPHISPDEPTEYHSARPAVLHALRSYNLETRAPAVQKRLEDNWAQHLSPNYQPQRNRPKSLVELGIVSQSSMKLVEHEFGRQITRSPITTLGYLFLIAREITKWNQKYIWEDVDQLDDWLKVNLYEIAEGFRYAYPASFGIALISARIFYQTAANMGDRKSVAELAFCYEMGIGGEKDLEVARKIRWSLNNM